VKGRVQLAGERALSFAQTCDRWQPDYSGSVNDHNGPNPAQTKRHLLYVACTRARDHLLVTGVDPASEFLDDFKKDDTTLAKHG
jgi:superfamily I DNA/RNA helicase